MAKVTYAQMAGVKAVLELWWNVKGLPWAFLQQLDTVAQAIAVGGETFDKLRKKFIDEYAVKDEYGEPVISDNGAVTLDDPELADAEWAKLLATEFDCPTLRSTDVEANAEKLWLTLGTLRTIKPVVEEVIQES